MALTLLGPEELDEPELPLPEFPELSELPPPNGEPLLKGFSVEPFPDEPEPDGRRLEPDEGAKDCALDPSVPLVRSDELHLDVGDLPASQKEGVRSAGAVNNGVNLRRATATRAPDGLTFLPPFAPLAER